LVHLKGWAFSFQSLIRAGRSGAAGWIRQGAFRTGGGEDPMSVDGAGRMTALAGTRDGAGIEGSTGQRPVTSSVIVLLAALLGFFMLSLDSTAVNVARASFLPGMRASLLIAVVVLAVAAATAVTLARPARENELTVLGR
jgi:hypothetical protein